MFQDKVFIITGGAHGIGRCIAVEALKIGGKGDIYLHPSGRIGTPYDIAKAVFFLCNPQARFINGENLTTDGGMTKQMIYHDDNG